MRLQCPGDGLLNQVIRVLLQRTHYRRKAPERGIQLPGRWQSPPLPASFFKKGVAMYELRFDGLFRAAQGVSHAGFMCIGWVIYRYEYMVAKGYGVIARGNDATSNIAEYLAMINGLQALLDMGVRWQPVRVIGDARVVINQMKGLSKVNTSRVIPVYRDANRLARRIHSIDWAWVPRKKNKTADRLTRKALREFLADPNEYRDAREKVLKDNAARRNQIHNLGGLLIFQPQNVGVFAQ